MGKGAKAEARLVGKVGALQQPRSVSELTGEELWPEPGSYHFGIASATRPGMGKGGELTRVSGVGRWALLQRCKGLKIRWGRSKGRAPGVVLAETPPQAARFAEQPWGSHLFQRSVQVCVSVWTMFYGSLLLAFCIFVRLF